MRFKRTSKQPPRARAKRTSVSRYGLALAVFGVVLLGGAAWAYQEVTRPPAPVPDDDALIPPPQIEPLSRFFPEYTAVYGRLSLSGPASTLVRHGMSGFGLGAIFDGLPWARYVLPGLNAMMGYPLLFDGNGDLALENQAVLESDETRRLLAEIAALAEGDVVLGIYATERGAQPFESALAAKLSNPLRAQAKIDELRRSFRGSTLLEGVRIEGGYLWLRTSSHGEATWWSDLQRDKAFKRTMAHLPKDRFATMYVNGVELRKLSRAYERYLQGGEEVGAELLGLAGGLVADPATQALLAQLESEGFAEHPIGTAATFRLGILQGHTHTDWQPQDPEALHQASEALLRASAARQPQLFEGAP